MKKKINIVLILVVAGLWGTVGYRFINNYLSSDAPNHMIGNKSNYTAKLVTQRDTFLLENIARDPFLNRSTPVNVNNYKSVVSKRSNNTVVKKVQSPKPILQAKYWPEIQYLGYMKSGKENEVVLLKINGQLMRMRKGESRNDLTIHTVYKDSVAVLFNKEKKFFKHS